MAMPPLCEADASMANSRRMPTYLLPALFWKVARRRFLENAEAVHWLAKVISKGGSHA